MGKLFDELSKDPRLKEGLKTCINCGTCTAICPAAEFYRYDPRKIVDTVQRKNDEEIEALLRSETIWYCGECMSCMTRCPRKNGAGLVIMALRHLSIRLGYFNVSEEKRQNETSEVREYYQGLPITSMAIILPFWWLIRGYLGQHYIFILHILVVIVGTLFISDIRVKKPQNPAVIIMVAAIALALAKMFHLI